MSVFVYRGVTCFVIGLFLHQKLLGVCVITSEIYCFVCIGHVSVLYRGVTCLYFVVLHHINHCFVCIRHCFVLHRVVFVFHNKCFCVSWFYVSVLVYYEVSSVFYVVSLMFGACGVFWCFLFGMHFPYDLCCCVLLFFVWMHRVLFVFVVASSVFGLSLCF